MKKTQRNISKYTLVIIALSIYLMLSSCLMGGIQDDGEEKALEQQDLSLQQKTKTKKTHNYNKYEETDECINGIIVYEGDNDFYVVETGHDYYVIRVWVGMLNTGARVRGDFRNMNTTYILDQLTNNQIRIEILYKAFTAELAIDWMGRHSALHPFDQETYDDWIRW